MRTGCGEHPGAAAASRTKRLLTPWQWFPSVPVCGTCHKREQTVDMVQSSGEPQRGGNGMNGVTTTDGCQVTVTGRPPTVLSAPPWSRPTPLRDRRSGLTASAGFRSGVPAVGGRLAPLCSSLPVSPQSNHR